jgi:hypothetical protein
MNHETHERHESKTRRVLWLSVLLCLLFGYFPFRVFGVFRGSPLLRVLRASVDLIPFLRSGLSVVELDGMQI